MRDEPDDDELRRRLLADSKPWNLPLDAFAGIAVFALLIIAAGWLA